MWRRWNHAFQLKEERPMNYQISEATRLAAQNLPGISERDELFANASARSVYKLVYRFIRMAHNSRDPKAHFAAARAIAAAWDSKHPAMLGMYELAFATYSENTSRLPEEIRRRNWMVSDRRPRIAE
jgi:hypothetical protein